MGEIAMIDSFRGNAGLANNDSAGAGLRRLLILLLAAMASSLSGCGGGDSEVKNEVVFSAKPQAALPGFFRNANPQDPRFTPDTQELLAYRDSSYRFLAIASNEALPLGFERPEFDDGKFATGSAAFGFEGGGGCPLQATVQTPWPAELQLLVRRFISVPDGANNVRVMLAADNDVLGVFFNGTRILSPITHDGCSKLDEIVVEVPQSLIQRERNLLAFHLVDRGVDSFFDARVVADIPLPELGRSLVRIARTVQNQVPKVPVSNVSVQCPPETGEISVDYSIPATGANASIKLRSSATDFVARYVLNGRQVSAVQSTTIQSRVRTAIESDFSIEEQNDLINIESLLQISESSRAAEPLFLCIQRAQEDGQSCFEKSKTEMECSACCREAGRTGRKLCTGGSAAVGAVPARFILAVAAAVMTAFSGDTCVDGVQEMETRCIRRCRNI
jgi:hypothetical protein